MDVGVIMNVAAIMISIMALIVSSLIAARQLKSARYSNDMTIVLDWLTREVTGEQFLESEAYVLDKLRKEQSSELGVSRLPLDARAHVLRVGRYYASLGQLVVFGAADERMVLSRINLRLRLAWSVIEPFAKVEREIRGAPFFAFFEHIAYRASEVDVPKIHRRLGLRAFGSSSALPPAVSQVGRLMGEGEVASTVQAQD